MARAFIAAMNQAPASCDDAAVSHLSRLSPHGIATCSAFDASPSVSHPKRPSKLARRAVNFATLNE